MTPPRTETPASLVRSALDPLLQPIGFTRKKMAWYRRTAETVFIIDVQKSQYGQQFFINVCVWLLELEPNDWPSVASSHIRVRLGTLLGPDPNPNPSEVFDMESTQGPTQRLVAMQRLVEELKPYIDAASTMSSLKSSDAGLKLIERSLVTGPAWDKLDM